MTEDRVLRHSPSVLDPPLAASRYRHDYGPGLSPAEAGPSDFSRPTHDRGRSSFSVSSSSLLSRAPTLPREPRLRRPRRTHMAVTNLREGVAAFVVGALTLLGTGCVAQQPQAAGAPPSSSPSPVETAPLATVETSAGAASPPETSSPETSPSEVGPTPRATPHVTFLRSGGVAGFADRLTLEPDGRVALTSRQREDVFICTVDERTARQIGLAVMAASSSTVRPRTPRRPGPPVPDLITYTVIVEGRRFDVPDGS